MDICSATSRDRGKLYICEKPLGHPAETNHQDGDHEWTQERSHGPNERILHN